MTNHLVEGLPLISRLSIFKTFRQTIRLNFERVRNVNFHYDSLPRRLSGHLGFFQAVLHLATVPNWRKGQPSRAISHSIHHQFQLTQRLPFLTWTKQKPSKWSSTWSSCVYLFKNDRMPFRITKAIQSQHSITQIDPNFGRMSTVIVAQYRYLENNKIGTIRFGAEAWLWWARRQHRWIHRPPIDPAWN